MKDDDKRLIELAAKSLGFEVTWGWVNPNGTHLYKDQPYVLGRAPWNPLIDDCLAFKLMSKLKIDIMFLDGFEEVKAESQDMLEAYVNYTHDRSSDVRRAVVQVAAKIGNERNCNEKEI